MLAIVRGPAVKVIEKVCKKDLVGKIGIRLKDFKTGSDAIHLNARSHCELVREVIATEQNDCCEKLREGTRHAIHLLSNDMNQVKCFVHNHNSIDFLHFANRDFLELTRTSTLSKNCMPNL